MKPVKEPKAYAQLATVKKNVDDEERGRVKVQFQWQKYNGKTTNWIRVKTLDAGSSGAFPKNPGHVFIPEIEDQVMIDFEYGDPSRPFVSGGMFPETKAKGGEIDNNIKSIKTRSGHMIEFNDEVTGGWGITIKDDCGNTIHLSTKGKNIDITAPETITLSAKNIQLNANENIKMSAGEDMIESAGKNKTDTAGEEHITSAKNKKVFVQEDSYTQVKKKVRVDVMKDAKVTVDDDVYLQAGKLSVNVIDEDTFEWYNFPERERNTTYFCAIEKPQENTRKLRGELISILPDEPGGMAMVEYTYGVKGELKEVDGLFAVRNDQREYEKKIRISPVSIQLD